MPAHQQGFSLQTSQVRCQDVEVQAVQVEHGD